MCNFGTEAEHLAEIEDYVSFDDYESYYDDEKQLYILSRGHCFRKQDVGKYVIIQNSRHNRKIMPTMYLVDRNKTRAFWWSPASWFAMVFNKKSAAEYQAKRYRFNKARVKQITPAMANLVYFEDNYEN